MGHTVMRSQAFRYEIIGHSESTRKLRERILTLKGNRAPVLVTGESGTGKELVAQMLSKVESPARNLVTVNCGAIHENLVESELFGHRRGAFTGAVRDQMGKFDPTACGSGLPAEPIFDSVGPNKYCVM